VKITLLKMTRKLWSSEEVPQHLNRVNQLKWAQAVYRLGDKWLLAQPVLKRIPV